MQFFKIDEKKLYEKYFQNMTLREFFALDHIPKGVDENQMRNMAIFLNNFVKENDEPVMDMTISDIMINFVINNNMVDLSEK